MKPKAEVVEIEGKKYLNVHIPIEEPRVSASGKTRVVGSAGGSAIVNGEIAKFTASAYLPLA